MKETFKEHPDRRNTKGRPLGAKGVKAAQWKYLGDFLTAHGAKRYIRVLQKMDDKDFVMAYASIIKYFQPQLRQVDATLTNGEGKPFRIGFVDEEQNTEEPGDE